MTSTYPVKAGQQHAGAPIGERAVRAVIDILKQFGEHVTRVSLLTLMLLTSACSSPAERHMERALCAGKGAVTHQEFLECKLRLRRQVPAQ